MTNNQFDCIPDDLRQRPQWLTWKRSKTGDKLPCSVATGKVADAHDPASRGTFEQAVAAAQRRHHAGIGYVFTDDDPFVGIDLDDCIDAGDVAPWARTIVDTMQTYTEISPSLTGLKMWVKGSIPKSLKTKQLEMYATGRFFTVTGQQLPGTPSSIRDVNGELSALYEAYRPTPTPQPTPAPLPQVAVDADHARRWSVAALEGEQRKMKDAGEGERHNRRYAGAYALAGLIPHITEDEITAAMAVNFGEDERSARKTIADAIAAGRLALRDIPPPTPRDNTYGLRFGTTVTEETIVDNPEAEQWRLVAQYWQEQAQMLDGWRAWAMAVAALPTERLSPAAKVAAFTLWPEMQSRAEQGIDEPKRIYIEEASTKAGLSAGTHGAKIKELASVGAIERIEHRQDNGHKKILIQPTTLWATPADWQPEAPRNHGGADRGQGRRPVQECPACGDEAPVVIETQTATRYVCGDCNTPLGHTFSKVKRHTWRANNQVDCSGATPVDDEANNQIAQIEENCSSPPINQIAGWVDAVEANNQLDCWAPPTRPAYIPPVALMEPADMPGVKSRTIAADDPWIGLQQMMAAQSGQAVTS